jgi:hypothetical protein
VIGEDARVGEDVRVGEEGGLGRKMSKNSNVVINGGGIHKGVGQIPGIFAVCDTLRVNCAAVEHLRLLAVTTHGLGKYFE